MKYKIYTEKKLLICEIDTEKREIIKFSKYFPSLQKVRIEKIKKENKEVNDAIE